MERTGNNIGAEGRRQHDPSDPGSGDKQDRQAQLADKEIHEATESGEALEPPKAVEQTTGGDRGEARQPEESGEPADIEAEPQADGEPYGDGNPAAPEGEKPVTRRRIEEADPESAG